MHLEQAKVGHTGLSVMSARGSDIKQQNAQISSRKMIIAEIILPTAKAAEAVDKAVDEVH